MGSTSSARPDNLEDFAKISHNLDEVLTTNLRKVIGDYHAFLDANTWGHFDADSLIGAYSRYINGNDFTARWVAQIAAAFRAAGGGRALVRLPDSAIKASLKAKGLDHGRHHVTFDKPVAWGSPPTTGYTDDPINTANGNFVEVESDLVCGGLAAGLTFDRTYNSRSDRAGPFGRGWSSWASVRLVPGPDGASYIGPDGQETLFPRMGEGFGRVVGVEALVEPLDSGLALRWLRGAGRWVFDEAGRLVSVTRGPGTEVQLEHDSAGRLVLTTHGGGKHVRLEWDAVADRVIALACSDGRRATYAYDDAGNLVEAVGAGGRRSYELDENARVVSVTDADGVVELVNTYDDDGRVTEQLSPFGRRTQIFYLPGGVTVTMDDDDDHPANTFVHDSEGRLTAVIDGHDQQLSTAYDDWGNPVAVTERNGAVTVQEYDELNRPVRRVLPTGASYTYVHDDADRLVQLAASNGAVTRYSFQGEERSPSEIIDAEGGVTRQLVRGGLVHQIVDPDGVTMNLDYDDDGDLLAATDAEGNVARLERDEAGRVTALVSPLGRRTLQFYDPQGLLVERHEPSGAVWRYEHTAAGRLASITDPTGAREEIRYGEHGQVAARVDALGHVTTTEHDVFGNVVEVVEPGGGAWRSEYDALMRLTATVDPTGARWGREYDVNGALAATVDPTGVRETAVLDAYGRVIKIDDGATSTSFEYDEFGHVSARLAADGSRAREEYDLLGRHTLSESLTGAITRVEYTPGGRIARRTYPSGRVDAFEYDACGRIAARSDGAGRRWGFRYDADGELCEVELPTGEIERFERDEAGRLTTLSTPGAGVTTCEYDPVGRVVTLADRDAGERHFSYDLAGRLVAAVAANGATTRYAHNERGAVVEVVDPLGGVTRGSYDAVGRITETIDQLGRALAVSYDAAGRLIEKVDASGRRGFVSYDASGRVKTFGAAGADPITVDYDVCGRPVAVAEPGSPLSTLVWDAEGRLIQRGRGDLAMRWSYDADGEREAISYPDGTQSAYVRDAGGYVVGVHHPALGTIDLERDAAGRLVGARADGMRAVWRHEGGDLVGYEMRAGERLRTAQLMRDPIGRVVEATIDGARHAFSYDAAGQLAGADTPAGAFVFDYDANGRLARESTPLGVADYEYDAVGQLEACVVADGAVTRYEYDGAGRRVREAGDELNRRYRWDESGRLTQVVTEHPGEGARTVDLVVDALGELAVVDGTPMMWDSAHPLQPLAWDGQHAVVGEGSPWALAGGTGVEWLAPDWQGTVGDTPRDPWGAPMGAGVGGTRLGFRGEIEFDAQTWLRQRIYQPASRAFLQPDALAPMPGSAVAGNPYHYAANNAIGLADPLGLHPVSEKELNAIRDRMGRGPLAGLGDIAKTIGNGALDVITKSAKFIYDNAGAIGMGLSIAAMIVPGGAVILGGAALVMGVMSAHNSLTKKPKPDYLGAVLDIAGVVPGVSALGKGVKAKRALDAAADLAKKGDDLRQGAQAAQRAHSLDYDGIADKYRESYEQYKKGADQLASGRAIRESAKSFEYGGMALGGVGVARTYGPQIVDLPPPPGPSGWKLWQPAQ